MLGAFFSSCYQDDALWRVHYSFTCLCVELFVVSIMLFVRFTFGFMMISHLLQILIFSGFIFSIASLDFMHTELDS